MFIIPGQRMVFEPPIIQRSKAPESVRIDALRAVLLLLGLQLRTMAQDDVRYVCWCVTPQGAAPQLCLLGKKIPITSSIYQP